MIYDPDIVNVGDNKLKLVSINPYYFQAKKRSNTNTTNEKKLLFQLDYIFYGMY